MDDAHSALLIISTIIVLFINFSIHSFNSALRELSNSDIEENNKEDRKEYRLKYFLEKKDKVLYCTHIVNILSVSFLGWFFVRTFSNVIKDKLLNTLPVSPAVGTFMGISAVLMFLLSPIIFIIDGVSYIILKLFGVDIKVQAETVSEEDIVSMLNEGHEQGIFEGSEAEMITNIFELNDKQARDVMTHRKSVVFINGEDTLQEVIDFMLTTGNNTRYPVYDENIDNIMGILNMKDALICENTSNYQNTAIKNIPNILRKPVFIPENKSLNTLFKEMQSHKNHMVVVVDEYGQTSGIVTMEDILEEIVGNILDEYDVDEELIKKLSDGSFIIKGMTPLSDIEDILNIKFDEEELDNFDTINGLMISGLDRIPEDNEKFDIIMHGYEFKALKVSNRTINTIKVTKLKEDEELKEE